MATKTKEKETVIEITGGGELPVLAYKVGGTTDSTAGASEQKTDSVINSMDDSLTKRTLSLPEEPTGHRAEINSALSGLGSSKFNFEDSDIAKRVEDSYTAAAKNAASDAMAKSAALTGGYSNSWAQSAASDAYNKYMSQYGEDILPNLYKTALSAYEAQNDAQTDYVKLLSELDSEDFDRYEGLLKQYLSEGDSLRDYFSDIYKTDSDEIIAKMKLLASL